MLQALALAATLALTACSSLNTDSRTDAPIGGSDDAGLRMAADRAEQALRGSPALVHHPTLQAQLGAMICQLSPENCDDVRVYVLRRPGFNASMLPNGAMEVWTGALLRSVSDAELAFVLGHELVHFEQRHTLQRWRDFERRSTYAQLVAALTGGATYGLAPLAFGTAMAAGSSAYSRDQERAADVGALAKMVAAGYDPRAAAVAAEQMLAEERVAGGQTWSVFTSHPNLAERAATLRREAEAAKAAPGVPATVVTALVEPMRPPWIEDELRAGPPRVSIAMFDALLRRAGADGALLYARGEARRRLGPDQLATAIEDLEAATAL